MKATRNVLLTALLPATLLAGWWAQPAASTATAQPAVTAADIQALRDALAAQQQQIHALQEELHHKNQSAQQSPSTGDQAKAQQDQQTVTQPEIDLASAKAVSNTAANQAALKNAVLSLQDPTRPPDPDGQQTYNKQMEGPLTIHFRGINITPGGYAAAEFVRRSRAIGADVQTPFNNLTMPGASQSSVPEFFGSGRQSKITTFVDGRLKNVDLSSYVSADFLSAGVPSTSTSTNGYTLRLRQPWGHHKFNNAWSF